MLLTLDYLKTRHHYWKNEIGKEGIWNPALFNDIVIQIRPKCKSYNGMFSRKRLLKNGRYVMTDRIIIYNNSEDFDPVFLDSILVHEMIHQYIYQGKIKDTSTHGKIFKDIMTRINQVFKGRLKINIADHNPSVPLTGPGDTTHLMVLSWTDKDCYCCVINPSKMNFFEIMLKGLEKSGNLKGHIWAKSNDCHFNRYARCTRTLHGVKHPIPKMTDFCKKYKITKINR